LYNPESSYYRQPTLPGQKHDAGKPEWDLVPALPMEEVVKVLTYGHKKYARDNWMLVDDPIRRYYAAAMRHLHAYQVARFVEEDSACALDHESGLHHLAHAACNLLFLLWHDQEEVAQCQRHRSEL